MNILFINNFDSFVYNLVDYFCQLKPEANVIIEDNWIKQFQNSQNGILIEIP